MQNIRTARLGIALLCALAIFGCASDSLGGGIAVGDLEGTWLAAFEEPLDWSGEGDYADYMVTELSSSDMEVIFYSDNGSNIQQVHGVRGAVAIEGDTLEYSINQVWLDDPDYNWITTSQFESMTFNLNSDILDLITPAGPVQLTKTDFSVRSELVDTWYTDGYNVTMVLFSDGTYDYTEVNGGLYEQSGTWDASTDYLRSVVTEDVDMGNDIYLGSLNPYTLTPGSPDVLEVIYTYNGEIVVTFTNQPPATD